MASRIRSGVLALHVVVAAVALESHAEAGPRPLVIVVHASIPVRVQIALSPHGELPCDSSDNVMVFDGTVDPKAGDVAPGLDPALANSGVDIVCERAVHHPAGNYEPPRCPCCDTPCEGAEDLFGEWLEGREPALECASCGKGAPLGDWSGEFSAYVSELAVRFNNWPELSPPFIEKLGRLLGSRLRVVYEHL